MQYRWTGVGRRNPMALHADSSQSHRPRDLNVASSWPDETAAAAASPPPLPPGRCGTPSSVTVASWILTRGPLSLSVSVLALVFFLGFFFFREAFLTVSVVAVAPAGASASAAAAVASRSLYSSIKSSGVRVYNSMFETYLVHTSRLFARLFVCAWLCASAFAGLFSSAFVLM